MYKLFIKPLLFKFNPETAHHFTFSILKNIHFIPFVKQILRSLYVFENEKLVVNVFGLNFKNPVGLAAGFDKDGKLINELANFGFGFIEVGTVTPLSQAGNDKPRLFRLPTDEAIINRMGFNNQGVKALVEKLKNVNADVIIGGNIGKNKITPNENAADDYEKCFIELFEWVHYFVVNVSSPNTPNLRELQEKEPLQNLLVKLNNLNTKLADRKQGKRKPILLKIAPDLTTGQLDDIIEIVRFSKIDGIVATNTTVTRHNLKTESSKVEQIGNGGLSGKPVKSRSTEIIRYITQKSNGTIPIIGVGGIHSPEDAKEKLAAGASLVQIYTGFIYEGPSLIKEINKSLV
jgi:dihydroorotate dehydrogenase